MGKFYFGHLSYNGTAYKGWQKQENLPTIQETLYLTARKICPNGNIKFFGASRTDARVNAFAQPVKFLLPNRFDGNKLQEKFNESLPKDIRFLRIDRINPSFKITHFVTDKTYLYFFSKKKKAKCPFVTLIPNEANVELMSEAAKLFIGKFNFKNYQYRSTVQGDFIREVLACDINQASSFFYSFNGDEDTFVLRIASKGFLKQMVRIIFGTLINVGLGTTTLDDVKKSLLENDDMKLGFIAPSEGLFLYQANYPVSMVEERPILAPPKLSDIFCCASTNIWKKDIAQQEITTA